MACFCFVALRAVKDWFNGEVFRFALSSAGSLTSADRTAFAVRLFFQPLPAKQLRGRFASST